MSPEHEALRLSILQDAVSIIHLIKNHLCNGRLHVCGFLEQEGTMKACLRGDVVNKKDVRRACGTISPVGLEVLRESIEDLLDRVGLGPPRGYSKRRALRRLFQPY
jgi:hypothetical protein